MTSATIFKSGRIICSVTEGNVDFRPNLTIPVFDNKTELSLIRFSRVKMEAVPLIELLGGKSLSSMFDNCGIKIVEPDSKTEPWRFISGQYEAIRPTPRVLQLYLVLYPEAVPEQEWPALQRELWIQAHRIF